MASLFRSKKEKEENRELQPNLVGQESGAENKGAQLPLLPGIKIPEKLPLLPLRDQVLYPGTVVPIFIDDLKLLNVISGYQMNQGLIATILLKPDVVKITKESFYSVGSASLVNRLMPVSQSGVMAVLQGAIKIGVSEILEENGIFWVVPQVQTEEEIKNEETVALMKTTLTLGQKVITNTPYLPKELLMVLEEIKEPLKLVYNIASVLRMDLKDKQSLLEMPSAFEKLKRLSAFLSKDVQMMELGGKITQGAQDEMAKFSREVYLREQLKKIKKELGEKNDGEQEAQEYRKKMKESGLPEEAQKEVQKELEHLEKTPSWSPDSQVVRSYLDWIFNLPWNNETKDDLDLAKAKETLNKDHYGLLDIKERILEYLAVRKLKADAKGSILCFVGPPGVGKTSLGQSIALALGRKFVRMSLGGVHDEAEIRGHRRTYIGAMPGRIIQSIKRAQSKNPVMMLDEIDKVGADFRGDVSSALLEVLDPEQNKNFRDHYLDVDFDLSKVFFITTANVLDTIQPALRDRMEIIKLAGYTLEEKMEIAKRHLLSKVMSENGLTQDLVEFEKGALAKIISNYTWEAGIRNLERQLSKISRKIAHKMALRKTGKVTIRERDLEKYLGPKKVFLETKRDVWGPGVVTGLAWTAAGGTIQFVEATSMPGKKGFALTGQMGEVMKESAQTALSLVRTRAESLKIDKNFFEKADIHIHVPEGAVPKDGPSAGVAMVCVLVSLLTKKAARQDVAMTGEVTLSGLVLPIGGLKEKILAAKRAGIKTIIIPKKNEGDLKEIDKPLKKGLRFVLVESIDQALKEAIPLVAESHPKPR